MKTTALIPVKMKDLLELPVITDVAITEFADKIDIPKTAADIVKLNILKKVIDAIDKNLKAEIAVHGLDAYGAYHGVKIEKFNTPTTYKLDNDAEYIILKSKVDERAKLLKQQAKLFDSHIIAGKNSDDFTGLVIDDEQLPVIESCPGCLLYTSPSPRD